MTGHAIDTQQFNNSKHKFIAKLRRTKAITSRTISHYLILLIDPVIAALLIICLSPVLTVHAIAGLFLNGQVFNHKKIIGKNAKIFSLLQFNNNLPGNKLAQLFNIIKGELAIIGPQANSNIDSERLCVRPGLFSLYSMRKRVGIAHDEVKTADREYIYKQSIKSNIGILIRNIIGMLLGGTNNRLTPCSIDFFDIPVCNTNMDDAVKCLLMMTQSKDKSQFAFVNPDCLNIAWKDVEYKKILQNIRYVLPDGIGIHLGCRIQNVALKANVNGTDLFPKLCESIAQTNLKIYLLGSKAEVAALTAKNMQKRYPGLKVCGTHHGYFEDSETDNIISKINTANPDILLVAMGAPLQEVWIARNREKLKVKVAMGVGGLFDFYSGQIVRAPIWMREIGMEWSWRILQEPKRMWRRYVIGNPLFLYRVWRNGKRYENQTESTNKKTTKSSNSRHSWNIFKLIRRCLWQHTATHSRYTKRLLDIVVSLSLLIVLSPIFILVAIAIKIDSTGSVFFKQRRVGLAGREFDFWKFRSMYIDAESHKAELIDNNEMDGVLFKIRNDPRVTHVGRIIRRTSIDELPQLWNVLRGDMSLVGPRPCLTTEAEQYSMYDRYRLDAEPGITCTWQVSGRSDIPFTQQIKMDVEYVHQSSWKRDFILLAKTIPAVISGRGAY